MKDTTKTGGAPGTVAGGFAVPPVAGNELNTGEIGPLVVKRVEAEDGITL